MSLNHKQQRFVDEYLIDLNATAAYKRAGYSSTGEAARVNASRLLTNDNVQEAIQQGIAKQSEKTGMDAAWVLQRLKGESEADGDGASHSARVRALELIGKHLGMFTDRIEHSGFTAPVIVGPDPDKVNGHANT